jgi:hypothetical protein
LHGGVRDQGESRKAGRLDANVRRRKPRHGKQRLGGMA